MLCEVCVGVELVFCCVGNDDDLCVVVLGEQGVFVGMVLGSLFVDYIIVLVEVVCELLLLVVECELGFFDVLVFGGQVGVVNGVLMVMVGGEEVFY